MKAVIYSGSRIEKIVPTKLQSIAASLRDMLFSLGSIKWKYRQDGVLSKHDFPFSKDCKFLKAKQAAISSVGLDYRIDLRLHQAIWASHNALQLRKISNFVELGTGRGFVMRSTVEYLRLCGFSHRFKLHLFDTFLPYSVDELGNQNSHYQKNPVYADSFEATKNNFTGLNVVFHPGKLPYELEKTNIVDISFLHIDLNSPSIEVACLQKLWPRIIPGGIVLIDDYAYEGNSLTTKVFDEFATRIGKVILTTASGQGILIR